MPNQKILSVIIPSYNTSAFIDECIPTFLDPRVINDIEVLIINDGSTDDTLEKAKFYEFNFNNSVRVITKENGGHGSTINVGICEAAGKYLKIVDGDDFVDTENFVQFISFLKQQNSDIVIADYGLMIHKTKSKIIPDSVIFKRSDDYSTFLLRNSIPGIHAQTLKSWILKENEISVSEGIFYVDLEFCAYSLPFIKSINYFPHTVVYYRVGVAGQSTSLSSSIKHFDDQYKVLTNLISYEAMQRNNLSDGKTAALRSLIVRTVVNLFRVLVHSKGSQLTRETKEFITLLKDIKISYIRRGLPVWCTIIIFTDGKFRKIFRCFWLIKKMVSK